MGGTKDDPVRCIPVMRHVGNFPEPMVRASRVQLSHLRPFFIPIVGAQDDDTRMEDRRGLRTGENQAQHRTRQILVGGLMPNEPTETPECLLAAAPKSKVPCPYVPLLVDFFVGLAQVPPLCRPNMIVCLLH